MAIPSKLKRYGYHVVIAIDQLFHALTGGAADETLSSRTYRGAMLAEQPKKRWRVLYLSSTVSSLIAITAKQLMKVN
nr:MAG TPA: hypothetical protein [Caudoviricetes sp.]